MAELLITSPLFAGLIIGIYEIILVHRDVTVPTHRFGHALHAVIIGLIASFAVFNVPWVYSIFPAITRIPLLGNVHVFRAAIGLFMMIKIHAASAAIKSTSGMSSVGLAEKWTHSFVVAALTVAAPYVWHYLPLPSWMKG